VCALLGIKPSPLVRRVLEPLADAQVEGKVKTKAEAEAFVLSIKNP
jgi:poly(A) polymerase